MVRMSTPETAGEITLQMSVIDGPTAEGLSYPTSNVRFSDLPADKPAASNADRFKEANPAIPEDAVVVSGVLQAYRLDRRQERAQIHSHGAFIEGTVDYDTYIERKLTSTGFWRGLFRRISMQGR